MQTGWSKKPPYFVFSLTFVVFNIFSKMFRHNVAKYQQILPYKLQVSIKKTLSAAVIDRQISGLKKLAKSVTFLRQADI